MYAPTTTGGCGTRLLARLGSPEPWQADELDDFFHPGSVPDHHRPVLLDALRGWQLSRPVQAGPARPLDDEGRAEVPVRSRPGADAVLVIRTDPDGRLAMARVRVDLPTAPRLTGHALFRARLAGLDGRLHLLARGTGEDVDSGERVPLGSVSKVFVLAALADRLRTDPGFGTRTARLEPRHVRSYSAGLTSTHIGDEITVRELARLSATLSDNTATDLLTELLGEETVARTVRRFDPGYPRPTLFTCHDLETAVSRYRAGHLTGLPHQQGLEWHHPLSAAADALAAQPQDTWNPWMSATAPQHVMHKGGRTPGVFSSLWRWRGSAGWTDLGFSFVSPYELGYIEEQLIHQAALEWITGAGLAPSSIRAASFLTPPGPVPISTASEEPS